MGTVTQYNLANVQAALGGVNPISMSEYYRGGAYVPTSRTVNVDDGPRYVYTAGSAGANYYWRVYVSGGTTSTRTSGFTWGGDPGSKSGIVIVDVGGTGVTSYTYLGATYLRGAYVQTVGSGTTFSPRFDLYQVTRRTTTTTTINTGVPSSGAISISQLYGAANP